jgi:hypothetical protein
MPHATKNQQDSDEEVVDSDFLSNGSDGEEGGDTPGLTPQQRPNRRVANGGALAGAARRLAGTLGRMERQQGAWVRCCCDADMWAGGNVCVHLSVMV